MKFFIVNSLESACLYPNITRLKSLVPSFLIVIALLIVGGCTTSSQPKVKTVSHEQNSSQSLEHNRSVVVEKKVAQEELKEEEGHIIENVFDDELYFEKDKVGVDKTALVIKYLHAYPWEKKALRRIYKKYKHLWSKRQSETFKKIVQDDKYASLCSDQKYWDNLEFEESEPERDILQSVLLLRYINNLSHGCPKWVKSNGKIKDENRKKDVEAKYIFSLLPHRVLIEKLLLLYAPKEKRFKRLLSEYKALVESDVDREKIKEKRLELEKFKAAEIHPNYRERER